MNKLKVTRVIRDKYGKIIAYDTTANGVSRRFTSKELKDLVRSKNLQISNYKITKDNRLIPVQSREQQIGCTRDAREYFKSIGLENIIDLIPVQSREQSTGYLLMNKDRKVLDISDNFVAGEQYGRTPYGFKDIKEWISRRKQISCAGDAKEFFKSIGIENVKDLIEVTHCVSLNDSFWIKRANSELKWKDVSPYRRDYSEVVSRYALEGEMPGISENEYFSPVIGTEGTFPHTWKFNGGEIIFIKAGSKYTLGGSNSGREPYSEYYASKVAEFLGFEHVEYKIRQHKRKDGRIDVVTECKCYCSEEIGSVAAHNLGIDSYEKAIEYCKSISGKAYKQILNMLFLDCLLLNTDRHFGNIEFMVNNSSLKVIDLAPIFDNNYALLPRFMEGYDTLDLDEYRARDKSRFEDLYNMICRHRKYTRELIKLKKFRLDKPRRVPISETRLKFLNDFLQSRVDYLIKLSE